MNINQHSPAAGSSRPGVLAQIHASSGKSWFLGRLVDADGCGGTVSRTRSVVAATNQWLTRLGRLDGMIPTVVASCRRSVATN
jgi:hypothetical protein